MKCLYYILRVTNMILAIMLILVVIYVFLYKNLLVKLNLQFFKEIKQLKLPLTEIVTVCYLLFFGITSLVYDTKCNFNSRIYCGWMRDTIGRGFFHFYCAISLWTMKNKCFPYYDSSFAKMSLDYLGWLYCAFGGIEILCSPCFSREKMEELFYKPFHSNIDCYNKSGNEIVAQRIEPFFSYFKQSVDKFSDIYCETIEKFPMAKDKNQAQDEKEQTEIFKLNNSDITIDKSSSIDYEDKRHNIQDISNEIIMSQDKMVSQKLNLSLEKDESNLNSSIYEQKNAVLDNMNKLDNFKPRENFNNSQVDVSNNQSLEKAENFVNRPETIKEHNCVKDQDTCIDDTIEQNLSADDDQKNYYVRLINDLGLEKILEEAISNELIKPIENGITMNDSHIDENHKYKIIMKEKKINKINHHEIYHEITMKYTPEEFSTFQAFVGANDRKKYDDLNETKQVLYRIEINSIVYTFQRFTTKKVMIIKGKETVFVHAFKRLSEKTVMEVAVSYDDKKYPVTKNFDRMFIIKAYYLYSKLDNLKLFDEANQKTVEQECWKMNHYAFVDPKVKMPLKLIKKILSSFYKNWYTNIFGVMDEYLIRNEGDMRKIVEDY